MITEISTKNMDYETWKSIRRKTIGGSDSAAIIGMNPYQSTYTLWAIKTNKVPEFEGNLATDVGTYLEDFVAKLFEKETGKKVRRKNAIIYNDEYPFAHGNLDREIVGENALLEIKTTDSLNSKKFKNGEFPDRYYSQIIHYLAVTGKQKGYLAVLIGNKEFKWFVIERDEEEIKALMKAEEYFWNNYVLTNTPPMVDGTDSTSDTLRTVYPESNGDSISLMAYENDLKQFMTLSSLLDDIKEQKEEVANRIKAFMGDCSRGECTKYKVSWSSFTKSTFDHKRFQADNPGIDLSAYYKSTVSRPFKVSEMN